MDKRSLVLYLSGLAAAGAVIGLAASCSDQPRIKCTAGHGPFAVVYTAMGAENCGLKGDQIGVEAYNYPLADKTNLDPNHGSIGMQPMDSLQPDIDSHDPEKTTGTHPYSTGDWQTPEPGADNFCNVPSLTAIEQNFAFVPQGETPTDGGAPTPAVAAANLKYEWKNVRFYNTPALPGTQMVADLSYSRADGTEDGGAPGTPCTAQFHVVGLWPSIPCNADDQPDGAPPTTPLDETKCSPEADNSKGRATGSGISPDLKTRCDPDLKLCVLVNEPH